LIVKDTVNKALRLAIVAAAAEAMDVGVPHYDGDFDLIASVTGQTCTWVVPAGTVD
jgi:hypothetical protein